MESAIRTEQSIAAGALGVAAVCAHCRHRLDDREALERALPGWGALGSAYGASLAASRLCRLRDRWVSPGDSCAGFSRAA